MSEILIIIITIILLIGFNALYVAAEFSAVAARRTKISQLAASGNRFARSLQPILENSKAKDNYLAASQVGITISSLVVGFYGENVITEKLIGPLTPVLTQVELWAQNVVLWLQGFNIAWLGGVDATSIDFSGGAAKSISFVSVLTFLTILQVVFGELIPKSLALQYPERVALALVIPMKWSLFVLRGFIWFFNGSGTFLLRFIPWTDGGSKGHSPEEIEILVTESHESGMLNDQLRQMLRNAFRFRDLTARQVMVHRTKLITATDDCTVLDLLKIAIDAGYSRILIYKETIDNIMGFVHVKDLFRLHVQNREDVSTILRKVLYLPETMPVLDVWERLYQSRNYLAVVFDEFGGTVGLITFEDLIEEIFGELQDEFDDEMALISRDKEGRIHLRGDLLVADVNEHLELKLPEETADTLGGLLFSKLGKPPKEGDELLFGDTEIRVEVVADLGIVEVSILLPSPDLIAPYSEWEVTDYDE